MTMTYDVQADAVYVTLRDVPYAFGHTTWTWNAALIVGRITGPVAVSFLA